MRAAARLAALALWLMPALALAQGCPHTGLNPTQVRQELSDAPTDPVITPGSFRDIACNSPNLGQNLADIPSPSTALANIDGNKADRRTTGTLPDARLSGNVPRLALNQQMTGGQAVAPVALTDQATIAVDCTKANDFVITLAGNRTLGNFTGCLGGQTLNFWFTQDATGGRTLAFGSQYKFAGAVAPVLTTAASATDFLSCRTKDASTAVCGGLIANISPPAPTLPNLLADCSTFNTANWILFGSPSDVPTFSGTLIADPNAVVDAQQITLTDPRDGFYQIPLPTLAANQTYTLSVYHKQISSTPAFYLVYYDGTHSVTQYSAKITPTGSWQRSAGFQITTGASDAAPSVGIADANVDGASQGNGGVLSLWGMKLELGSVETPFNGCVTTPSGRQWAFFDSPGNDNVTDWPALNSGWAAQPIDGLHVYTATNNSFFAGKDISPWTPTPTRVLMSDDYGGNGNVVDMGQAAIGTYDSTWLGWLNADASGSVATVKVVRIWQEINGNWMPWSVNQTGATSVDGTPNGTAWPAATIRGAFQHMATQVRSAFPNALIEFNLSEGGPFTGPTGPGDGSGYDLYPGDAYVDVVGLDSYEKDVSYASLLNNSASVNLTNLKSFAATHGKLVADSEWATANCDGAYVTSLTGFFDGLGTSAAYLAFYEQNNSAASNVLFATSGQPGACAANTIRQALNNSNFGQKALKSPWP